LLICVKNFGINTVKKSFFFGPSYLGVSMATWVKVNTNDAAKGCRPSLAVCAGIFRDNRGNINNFSSF